MQWQQEFAADLLLGHCFHYCGTLATDDARSQAMLSLESINFRTAKADLFRGFGCVAEQVYCTVMLKSEEEVNVGLVEQMQYLFGHVELNVSLSVTASSILVDSLRTPALVQRTGTASRLFLTLT